VIDFSNQLKGEYNKRFLSAKLSNLVKQIPKDKRKDLAELIQARASLGVGNPVALSKALKLLKEAK